MRLFLWFSNTVFGKERCLVWSLFCLNDDGALMLTSSYFPVPVCWPCNTFYPCLLYPWHMHASHSAYGAAKPRELLKQTGTITFFSTRKRWVVLFLKGKWLFRSQYFKIAKKKSHSILRVKRATFTLSVAKSSLKMPKNGSFWRFFESLKIAAK